MATFKVQFRRGTTAEHATFTGAQGEITYDTETNQLVLHDGVTPGGHRIPLITDVPTDLNQLTDANDVLPQLAPTSTGVWYGDRATIIGGFNFNTVSNYYNITTISTATTFGALTNGWTRDHTGFSDGSNIIWGGNYSSANYGYDLTSRISSVTLGAQEEFGTLVAGTRAGCGASNGAYGFFAGGRPADAAVPQRTIDYIVMETANDSTTFGELSANLGAAGGTAAGDLTRALVKTNGSSFQRRLEYITYDTPGNSTTFGLLTDNRSDAKATSDQTRAYYFGGSYSYKNDSTTIDYVTIQTLGNTTTFGNLILPRTYGGDACSDGTRATVNGGYCTQPDSSWGVDNSIEYITMGTSGSATDFGDLTQANHRGIATSGSSS